MCIRDRAITVGANDTLNITNDTLTLTGTGTPLTITAGGTLTVTGSTVDYNGSAQTVGAINYNNLTLSNSGAKTLQTGTTSLSGNLTLNGTASYSNLPGIGALISLSANIMQTGYLNGQVYGASLSKDIVQGKLSTMFNYRHVDFKYANVNSELRQNIGELDLTYQFNKKLYLSVNYESTFQDKENLNRIYLNLRWKF